MFIHVPFHRVAVLVHCFSLWTKFHWWSELQRVELCDMDDPNFKTACELLFVGEHSQRGGFRNMFKFFGVGRRVGTLTLVCPLHSFPLTFVYLLFRLLLPLFVLYVRLFLLALLFTSVYFNLYLPVMSIYFTISLTFIFALTLV
jgi:hypothetical protein